MSFLFAAAADEEEEEGPAPHNFSLKVVVVVVVVGEAIFAVVYAASESLLRSFSAVCGGTDIFSLGEWGEERGDEEGMRVLVVLVVLVVEVGGCSKFLRMVRAGTVKASRGVEAKSREVTSGLVVAVAVVMGVVTSS